MKKSGRFAFLVLCLWGLLPACQKAETPAPARKQLTVVATIFPFFDFARTVAGGKANVVLLLPPGVEPHAFEPTPSAFAAVNNADIFLYTGKDMEHWAVKILEGIGNKNLNVVDASRGLTPRKMEPGATGPGKGSVSGGDPHIWMDFAYDQEIVDTLARAMAGKDPLNADYYRDNAAHLKAKLSALDMRYAEILKVCKKKIIVHGGHYAFGYLAARYQLQYVAAMGLSPDAEPTPGKIAALVKLIRKNGLKTVYYEELINPAVANAVAEETGVAIEELNAAHNLDKDEFEKGTTFLQIMEANLEKLKKGLECQR